jgi:hypothetical protein
VSRDSSVVYRSWDEVETLTVPIQLPLAFLHRSTLATSPRLLPLLRTVFAFYFIHLTTYRLVHVLFNLAKLIVVGQWYLLSCGRESISL